MENAEQSAPDSAPSVEDRLEQLFGPGEQPEEVEQQAAESAADEQPETPPEPELEEVEWEGEKHKLPPKIKSALMAQADYTRKTQALAEQRREVESQVSRMQQEALFNQSVGQEVSQLQRISASLEAYKALDWANMDTDTHIRTKHQYDQLKEQRDDLQRTLQMKRGQFEQHVTALRKQAQEKMNEYLRGVIPNYSPELRKSLDSYGQTQGYTDLELNEADSRGLQMMWKAMQWDQLQSQKAVTTKRAEQVPPVAKPGAVKQNIPAMNFAKAKQGAKTSSARARVIQDELARRWG